MTKFDIIKIKKLSKADQETNTRYLQVGSVWKLNSNDLKVLVEIKKIKGTTVYLKPKFKTVDADLLDMSITQFLEVHKPTKRSRKLIDANITTDNDCKAPNVKVGFHIMLGMLTKCPDLIAHRTTYLPDNTVYIEEVDGKPELWVASGDPKAGVSSKPYYPTQADLFATDWIVQRGE